MGFSLIFLKYFNVIAYVFGLTGNLAIIVLILSQEDQYIKKYSAFLLQTTFLEAFITLTSLCVLPISGKVENLYYAFSGNNFLNYEIMGLLIIMSIYFSVIITAVGATSVPFYIRYLVICRKKVIQLRHYFWVYSILVMLFSVLFFIIFFILQYGTALYGNYSRMVGNKAIFTGNLFITSFSLIIFTLSGISMAYIYRLHCRILKELASKNVFMHIKIKTLSKSLQDTLYTQNLCMLFAAIITSFILLISSFLECDHCISYGFLFITWAPISNIFCVFIMMKPFRQIISRIFKLLCFKKTTQVSAFSVNANYFN